MRIRPVVAALAAFTGLLALATPEALAQDVVDLEVAGNGAVQGTIRPAFDRERFQVVVGRGTRIRAVAKAKAKKGPFVPSIDLAGPSSDDTLVAGTLKGRASTFKTAAPLTVGGAHAVRVTTATGSDGDYVLQFTVLPQRLFRATGEATPGQTGIEMVFGAPPNAKARIILTPKKSGFVPALDELVAPSGAISALTGAKAGPIALAQGGDWTVRFHDAGAVGGEWTCQVILTLPKKRTSKINITAAALTGSFADQQPVFGRLVSPSDGDILLDPPDSGGGLDGAELLIPGGAMPFPVVVSVSEVPQFPPGDGNNPAGPAVQFGPDGLKFNSDATLTIPYDPEQFTDPANELEVYVVHADGIPAKVEPRSLLDFSQPGVVTFPITGFSTYMPASSRPRPVTGQWIIGQLYATSLDDFGGFAGAEVGRIDFTPGSEVPEYFFSIFGNFSEWSRTGFPPAGGPDPSARTQSAFESDSGTWDESVGSAGRVSLISFNEEFTSLVRRVGGDVLLRRPEADGTEVAGSFALRAAEGFPTLTNVSGTWHVLAVGAAAEETGGTPRNVQLSTETNLGTATFGTDGRAVFAIDESVRSQSDFPTGAWAGEKRGFRGTGQIEINDARLLLALPSDGGKLQSPFVLYPCLGGEVLLGSPQSGGEQPMLFILVRQARNFSKTALSGPADFVHFSWLLDNSPSEGVPQGLHGFGVGGTRRHDGKGGLTVDSAFGAQTGHETGSGRPLSSSANEKFSTGTYSVSPIGVYRESTGIEGFLARSRQCFFGVSNTAGRSTFVIGVPGLDSFSD